MCAVLSGELGRDALVRISFEDRTTTGIHGTAIVL